MNNINYKQNMGTANVQEKIERAKEATRDINFDACCAGGRAFEEQKRVDEAQTLDISMPGTPI